MIKLLLTLFPRPFLIRISYFLAPIFSILYKGKHFTDPVNGKSYRKFLSYGYGKTRKNALAPATLSLERHRLMWLYLQRETNFFSQNLKVLHMAPEQCFLGRFKKMTNLEYITADLYSPIVDIKADLLNLPFDDNSFDVVFCNHVLEHIEEDSKAMSELYRVMKPNGWGIFQIPRKPGLEKTYEDFSITQPEERQKHFGQYDHVRWYGMDYFHRLEKVGFTVKQIKYFETLPPEEVERFALDKNEILPVVLKL